MPLTITNSEIDAHELLNSDLGKVCRILRNKARTDRQPFTMLDFAKVHLRATGTNYTEADTERDAIEADREHQQAAILFVYEALKACELAIIKEWPEFDEMLKNLVYLAQEI